MSAKTDKTEAEWREQLSDEEFQVCRQKGTEPAFSGEYYDCDETGQYLCKCCGEKLFDSETKFDSGSGWPSFWASANHGAIITETDQSHGMARTEVMCAKCGAHLGHVFPDGPEPTGQRYCINSIAIKLSATD